MSVFISNIHDQPIVSLKDKEAKDFESIKNTVEPILRTDIGPKERLKMKINLDLLNGSLDPQLYDDPFCFDIKNDKGEYETISYDHQNISHTPWIATFANSFIGEQIQNRFSPGILDNRTNKNTLHKQQNSIPLKAFFEDLVRTSQSAILEQIVQGNTDLLRDPEVQKQVQQLVQQSLEKQMPETILQYLKGEYVAPTPRMASSILKHHLKKDDIKYVTQAEGFKYAVAHGAEYYFAGDWNGRLEFRAENPMNILWGCGSRYDEKIENADWIKRTDFVSLTQAMSRHSDTLSEKDIKKLENYFSTYSENGSTQPFWGDNARTKELMWKYSEESQEFQEHYASYSRNTQEGQDKFIEMYNRLMGNSGWESRYSDCGIREDHILIRLPMKMYRIQRFKPNGEEYFVERADHYEPVHTDGEVVEIRREVIYEMFVLNQEIFTGIRPLKCQYSSPENYRLPKMPYYGQRYDTHNNTVIGRSMIDRAKSSQKMYDVTLASIKKDLATDMGTVFMMFMNLKPKDWEYQKWLDLMINAGIMWIDPKNRAMNNVDPQMLREVNLSKMGAVAAKLQMLDYWKSNIATSLFFSEDRGEAFGQYATNNNIEQTTRRVFSKTALFDEKHRIIVERALTGYINRARYYYKEHPEEAAVFLDDIQLQLLVSQPLSSFEYLGVEVDNSNDQDAKLSKVQNLMLTALQNGFDTESAIDIVCTNDVNDIRDIVKKATSRAERRRQEDLQVQQTQEQQKAAAEAAEKDKDRNLKLLMHQSDLASKERRSVVDSNKFLLANDVDKNRISDLLEGTLARIQADKEMHKDKIDVEKLKLQLKEKLNESPRI